MSLENIGLQLETSIYDKSTETQAIVATNTIPQVDGEEDSIIVVAFRGTSSTKNVKTDLKFRQVRSYYACNACRFLSCPHILLLAASPSAGPSPGANDGC